MSDLLNTPITIAFSHADGRHQPLGAGSIDAMGMIAIDTFESGQDEYLGGLVAELNGRENIILKEPPAEGADRFSITKRKVLRSDPEFLAEFAHYCERVYSLALEFDASVFVVADPDAPVHHALPDAPVSVDVVVGRPEVVIDPDKVIDRFAPDVPDDDDDDTGDDSDAFASTPTEPAVDDLVLEEPEPRP